LVETKETEMNKRVWVLFILSIVAVLGHLHFVLGMEYIPYGVWGPDTSEQQRRIVTSIGLAMSLPGVFFWPWVLTHPNWLIKTDERSGS
jgi:hypothetical protein